MSIASGTKQQSLNLGSIASIPIPLPPLDEQKHIADVLATLDKWVDGLAESIRLVEQLKKGLMQVLLTGKVRVKV